MKLAAVRFEGESFGDPRFAHLARILGYQNGDGHFALIKVGLVWSWQTEHYTPENPCFVVPADVIEMALGEGGPTAMVKARLAEETPDGYRIRGSNDDRTGWLWRLRSKSQKGGVASAEKRSKRPRKAPEKRNADIKETPVVEHGQTTAQALVIPLSSLLSVQDQTQTVPAGTSAKAKPVVTAAQDPDHKRVVATHWREFEARLGSKPTWRDETGKQVKDLLKSHSADEICKRLENFHRRPPGSFPPDDDFRSFLTHIDKFASRQPTPLSGIRSIPKL